MEMCILSGIYVWTKIIEMMAVELKRFSVKQASHRIVMKLTWLLNNYIRMCILTEIIEKMTVET